MSGFHNEILKTVRAKTAIIICYHYFIKIIFM